MDFKRLALKEELADRTVFYILLGIFLSLAFSIRFINSFSIILLLVIVLLHPRRKEWFQHAIKNTFFLAAFALLLLKTAGIFYADDRDQAWFEVSSKASLFVIPLFFSFYKSSREERIKLLSYFSFALAIVAAICLVIAAIKFSNNGNSELFFYHSLVAPFRHHAIFFSFYLFFCIVYWLEEGIYFVNPGGFKKFILFLLVFFFFLIFLLSSKLVLALCSLYLLCKAVIGNLKNKKWRYIFSGSLLLLSVVLILTNNPVKDRYQEMFSGSALVFKQEKFSPDTYLNGLQFRLLIWRFTGEILTFNKAWLFGLSPADAQPALEKKYIAADLYQGDGSTDRGYLAFNCHNAFLQASLESGIIGLLLVLLMIFSFFRSAFRSRNSAALIFFAGIIAFCFTESVLSSQYALLLFLFFPLFLLQRSEQKVIK